MVKPTLHLISFKNHDICQQLLLEEALLRATNQNWCILNHGAPPRIVMGISGQVEKFVDLKKLEASPLPILKRYSGGGTVIVDEDTCFVSFIFQKDIHPFPCYPEPILRWSEKLYQEAFAIPKFHLRENDYVIDKKKCGGNAQYIKKDRFVHHTTFLWDFKKRYMDYLCHPEKTPQYRLGRDHGNFLCRMKDYLPEKEIFFERLIQVLQSRYELKKISFEDVSPLLLGSHRTVTSRIR